MITNEQKEKALQRIKKTQEVAVAKVRKNTTRSIARLVLGVDFFEKNKDFLYGAFSFGSFVSSISFFYHNQNEIGFTLLAISAFLVIAKSRVPQGNITTYVSSDETTIGKMGNKTTASFVVYAVGAYGLYFFENQRWFEFFGAVLVAGLVSVFRPKLPESELAKVIQKDEIQLKEDADARTIYKS